MAVISQSNLGRGSTVAASVSVGYDWGERDGFQDLLKILNNNISSTDISTRGKLIPFPKRSSL